MYSKYGFPLRTLGTCQIFLKMIPSRNFEEDFAVFVQEIEARETEGDSEEMKEEEHPPMETMHHHLSLKLQT